MATECNNRQHSAVFPVALPDWLFKLFTREGDLVLDPFNGFVTTYVAEQRLSRNYIGIDINPDYCALARGRLNKEKLTGKNKEMPLTRLTWIKCAIM